MPAGAERVPGEGARGGINTRLWGRSARKAPWGGGWGVTEGLGWMGPPERVSPIAPL